MAETEDNLDVLAPGAYCEAGHPDHERPQPCSLGRVTLERIELGPLPWGRSGMSVNIRMPDGDALYTFRTRLLDVSEEYGHGYWIAERPRSVERHQRRRHLRARLELPVMVSDLMGDPPGEWLARTLDLSGGGACIRLPPEFRTRVHQMLVLVLSLLPARPVRVLGEVIRTYEDGGHGFAGLQFVNLAPHEEELLVREAFKAHWKNWQVLKQEALSRADEGIHGRA